MKIPLPKLERTSLATAHPFPFMIGIQAEEFIQATVFYWILSDTATGKLFRIPGGLEKVQQALQESGLTKGQWQEEWNRLEKYKLAFNAYALQGVVIFIFSHWDWYIRHLRDFVLFAIDQTPEILLDNKLEKQLKRIDSIDVLNQLALLEQVCQITFSLSADTRVAIKEMSLARNIGLHNRWEVDEYYLDKSTIKGLSSGDIRIITKDDLYIWSSSVRTLIQTTATGIAKRFAHITEYTLPV